MSAGCREQLPHLLLADLPFEPALRRRLLGPLCAALWPLRHCQVLRQLLHRDRLAGAQVVEQILSAVAVEVLVRHVQHA